MADAEAIVIASTDRMHVAVKNKSIYLRAGFAAIAGERTTTMTATQAQEVVDALQLAIYEVHNG